VAKDRQPNSHEIAKAVVLSSLAYLDNQSATATVERRYSDIGFERILMAPHFILGFDPKEDGCNTTLYVAFRRRLSIQDMFAVKVADRSEFIDSYGEAAKDVEGLFNYDLFERITSELPSMSHFQNYKANRIIFSGHGLAGALAHLFLICYMIKTREEDREHISIGFGSPYFCDDSAKRFCRKTMELDRRMFTFVNDADPVPWMLEGIRMTCTPESVGRRGETKCFCLERLSIWLDSENSDEKMEIAIPMLEPVQTILSEMGHIAWFNMPFYASIGMYPGASTCRFISMIQQWVSRLIGYNRIISRVRTLDVDSWECHRVESYVKEFASYIHTERFPIKPVMEIAHNPCIYACTLNVYNVETNYEGVITITGSDLSDGCGMESNVEPNVGHDWKVEDTSESSCVLVRGFLTEMEANAINIWKKDEIVGQTHLFLELRTCYDSTHADVHVEDLWYDGSVASALTRGMGRLLLMQQSEVLVKSDMYRKAYETLESVFAGTLDHLSYSRPETKRDHFELVKSSLTRPVEIFIQDVQPIIESTEGVLKNSHLFLSASFSSRPECFQIPDYKWISKFFHDGSHFSRSDGRVGILNYRDILRTIYCLLSGTESQGEQSDVSYYETEIYKFQEQGGQMVKTRQALQEGLQKDIEKRASMMYKVRTASNLLESLRFAAFIGPENAGKTTLINSILGDNVGGVGFTTHTTAATPYRFRDDIFLVDFPGTDGGGDRAHLSKIWEDYEKVADLCVVVLNFGGDTSREAQVFPMIARSRMCGNVVLVINRVDSVLNGSRNSPVWAEYSADKVEQLKISIAENSGLPADRVFFSVSRTSEELEETTRQLLKERLIMLKDEITSTVRGLLLGL